MMTNVASKVPAAGWKTVTAVSLLALLSPLLWPGVMRNLFASGYMPHGHCYFWTRPLVSLHLITDSIIGIAYTAISASLVYLVHRARRDLPFHWIILVFGAFIVACGATHFMEVWTIWNATYWLSGAVKMITAIASVGAAAAMPFTIPAVLKLIANARYAREHQQDLRLAHLELQAAYDRQREIDEILQREHRYVTALLSSLHEQVVICDSEGTVVFNTRSEEEEINREEAYPTLDEVLTNLDVIDPVTKEPIAIKDRPIHRALRGEILEEMPVQFLNDGEWRSGVATARPVVDREGRSIGAMAVIRDVTDERVARETIANLQRRNDLILSAAGEGICGIDLQGRTMLMNPAAERISGWRIDQLAGHLRHAKVHHTHPDGSPYPWHDCPEYLTLRDGRPRKVTDEIFWKPDGSWFPVEYHVTPIREGEVITGAVVTFQDTSERKRLEQDLEQARRVESLGRLAATIAHEFNNVLMGIQPFVEVIGVAAPDHADIAKSLNFISVAVQRGKRVSQDILRFTQPAEPILEKIGVQAWASQLIGQVRPLLGQRIQLEVDLPAEVEGILGDGAQLQQVFLNLFMNARDAMPDGGTIRFAATLSDAATNFSFGTITSPADFVHFTVADTGPGIPPEVMKHLFEPLFTTKKSGGTGLGLTLVSQVISRHAGHVFAESKLGEGTVFHVFIRRAEAPPLPIADFRPRGNLAGRRILLVEDEQAVSAGLEILLEIEAMEVRTVDRGAVALDAIEEFLPDVVVLDVGLPDISGDEVYRQIANRFPSMPVIFSTGHADPTKLHEHTSRRNVRFLSKPYTGGDLLLMVEELLSEPSNAGDRVP